MSLEIRELSSDAGRDAYLPLFRLADDSEAELQGYYRQGDLYVLVESQGDEARGMVLVLPTSTPDTVELKSVAIVEEQQGRGLGRFMIGEVLARLRGRGVGRVIVATSNASIDAIAFYQKCGFRLWRIERDAFSPEKGYGADCMEHGIRVRDRVWLDIEI